MTDMDILSEMIQDAARVTPDEEYGKRIVELCEKEKKESKVTIQNMPDDAFIINVDEYFSTNKIFKGKNGECSRADYIIISEEQKCILYIELKYESDPWCKVIQQLLGAQCFLKYCREVGKEFWDDRNFLRDYKNRFVSINHTGTQKRKPKYDSSQCHDTPEKAMRVDWAKFIQFNRIARVNA